MRVGGVAREGGTGESGGGTEPQTTGTKRHTGGSQGRREEKGARGKDQNEEIYHGGA